MEDICAENGVVDGCQLLHSAKTMKIMSLMKPETLKEAFAITEEKFKWACTTIRRGLLVKSVAGTREIITNSADT
jgi:hypothetical protein